MALGRIAKEQPHLLDTLLVLSDIIKQLGSTEAADLIKEIKAEKEKHDEAHAKMSALKREHDHTISELQKKIKEHESVSVEAGKNKQHIEESIATQTKILQRAQAENAAIEKNKQTAEKHITDLNLALDVREKSLVHREEAISELKKQSQAIKEEYEQKLQHLKNITG